MGKLALKCCPSCGMYHDISVKSCGCGKDLSLVRAKLTDSSVYGRMRGTVDETLKVYYQKCTNCGEMNFTLNPDVSIGRCGNCAKKRLSPSLPVEYQDEEVPPPAETVSPYEGELRAEHQMASIMDSVKSMARQNPAIPAEAPEPASGKAENPAVSAADEESEEEAAPDWDSLLGDEGAEEKPSQRKKTTLTMTAVRYGRCTIILKEADCAAPVMLGRSALKADFLSQDLRVGNNHCVIFFRDGEWFVRDNNSANGTAVNGMDIGLGGESRLSDGNLLKLGHHPDSMEFTVSIG